MSDEDRKRLEAALEWARQDPDQLDVDECIALVEQEQETEPKGKRRPISAAEVVRRKLAGKP